MTRGGLDLVASTQPDLAALWPDREVKVHTPIRPTGAGVALGLRHRPPIRSRVRECAWPKCFRDNGGDVKLDSLGNWYRGAIVARSHSGHTHSIVTRRSACAVERLAERSVRCSACALRPHLPPS